MGTHPSKKFEDGVLVERAIPTNDPGDPVEDPDFVSGTKTYKTPVATKRVAAAENKAVSKADAK